MKKLVILLLCFIFVGVFVINLAIADSSANSNPATESGKEERIKENKGEIGREIKQRDIEIKERIENEGERKDMTAKFRERIKKNGGIIEIDGREINIKEINENDKEIIIGRIKAKVRVDLFDENKTGKGRILRAILSNGRFADIKIMPDRAAAIALERLKAKCDENNCTIELKEIGRDNETKLKYELETNKEGRLLFLFKIKMKVKAEVDPETGEVSIKKPWWRFLFFVREKDEDINGIENELGNETKLSNETDRKDKVTLCHIPPGNENTAHTIIVGGSAVKAHLAHGDYLGVCKTGKNQTNGDQTGPDNETVKNETKMNNITVNIDAAVGVGSTS